MTKVQDFVESKIKGKPVVVFSMTWCPYCKKAKETLSKFNLPADKYEVIEMDNDPDAEEFQEYMEKTTGAGSFPRVFIGGKCIGGGDDTVKLQKSGELETLLKSVHAL